MDEELIASPELKGPTSASDTQSITMERCEFESP